MMLSILVLSALVAVSSATELTFDMKPHETQCFYDYIKKGTDITVEFQVVYGGRLDVDVEVKFGNSRLWQEKRKQTGEHSFKAHETGEYSFCFSNQFSTVTHKTIYVDIIVGDEDDPPVDPEEANHLTALTRMETSVASIHNSLKKIIDMQTHYRMREATHRLTAEFMNERVQWVSAGEALVLIAISIFQILYLRYLFSERPYRR